ncbi:hypothetical protein HME9302_02086 [Alteripontixanthobacter maritimus]|uniref:Uncharacterized protein n=1 Tax=Alteripontixanthobacter maritimus TaxID=2161824 RepID=A0A369Q943_9SPHN|nr:hypothetical protein [Alteripontixanthobacter maritimus]RDC60870.1 hypothetical protein HME9302_02086 [Alteripontixanthobacter maritimus]
MKRSGGDAGRPMRHYSIGQLEENVTRCTTDNDELQLVLAELGYRKTNRATELKDLVKRLIDTNRRARIAAIGPLFRNF